MKKVIAGVALVATTLPAAAAEFGVGVSVQSDDAWIYAPIDISPRFRIEPSLRFQSFESTSTSDGGFGDPLDVKQEGDTWEFAVGIFGLAPIADKLRMYYGARLAYLDNQSELRISDDSEELEAQESSSDGYRISPTLGFEYAFTEHFSLGAEAEWFYQKMDSEGSYSRFGPDAIQSDGDFESTGTDTRLIVRFRF